MKIEPLSKSIYEKAKTLGIKEIVLEFSGGNDEGHLYASTSPYNGEFGQEIEDWAWSVYEYSGAGDGNDYGDTIIYDLVKGKATSQEWYMSRTEGETEEIDL